MANLRTRYLGLDLDHPVIASASPLSYTLDGIRRLEDGGVSAVVLFSLFEEQIRRSDRAHEWLRAGWSASPRSPTDLTPRRADYDPLAYLELIRRAKESVGIPIVGSLNGVTDEDWTSYARSIEEAGADALELNVFNVPADPSLSGRDVEHRLVEVVHAVRRAVAIPLAVKLSPYFSAPAEMARRLLVAGADALVLFNRFYQPDFDLERLELSTDVQLSSPGEIRLPLLWISVLYGRLPMSLAATTGVESYREVVKYLLAGADVAMVASALLRHGPEHADTIVRELARWMDQREFRSVSELRGFMSQLGVTDPEAYERTNYLRVLQAYATA